MRWNTPRPGDPIPESWFAVIVGASHEESPDDIVDKCLWMDRTYAPSGELNGPANRTDDDIETMGAFRSCMEEVFETAFDHMTGRPSQLSRMRPQGIHNLLYRGMNDFKEFFKRGAGNHVAERLYDSALSYAEETGSTLSPEMLFAVADVDYDVIVDAIVRATDTPAPLLKKRW